MCLQHGQQQQDKTSHAQDDFLFLPDSSAVSQYDFKFASILIKLAIFHGFEIYGDFTALEA